MAGNINYSDNSVKDLDTIMKVYREWAWKMHPKFQFSDVIDKIERHCRTSSMKVSITHALLDPC